MRANLIENRNMSKLPAGIVSGIEGFWYNDEKWVIFEGRTTRLTEAPAKVQRQLANLFLRDNQSRGYLKSIGVTAFSAAFDNWYKCVLGGLDSVPDITPDGTLTPDAYNNMCTDHACPHRGKLCSIRTGLKNYEIETIQALETGKTFEQAADQLCISLPGIKSRVEKIKEKLGANNERSMIAAAARLGIL